MCQLTTVKLSSVRYQRRLQVLAPCSLQRQDDDDDEEDEEILPVSDEYAAQWQVYYAVRR